MCSCCHMQRMLYVINMFCVKCGRRTFLRIVKGFIAIVPSSHPLIHSTVAITNPTSPLNDTALPKVTKSSTDIDEPILPQPYMERERPKRVIDRIEMDELILMESKTLHELPNRIMPYT